MPPSCHANALGDFSVLLIQGVKSFHLLLYIKRASFGCLFLSMYFSWLYKNDVTMTKCRADVMSVSSPHRQLCRQPLSEAFGLERGDSQPLLQRRQ
ncbi:hypothetical protein DXU84_03950 [Rahnella sp. RcJ3]|nr:hypothetical protein [Rahnella sp. RcJ3]